MRWLLGAAGAAALLLGCCIADRQGRGVTLTAADAALCRGPDRVRCRGALAQDTERAGAAETLRLRYAMERVGASLAHGDDPNASSGAERRPPTAAS